MRTGGTTALPSSILVVGIVATSPHAKADAAIGRLCVSEAAAV